MRRSAQFARLRGTRLAPQPDAKPYSRAPPVAADAFGGDLDVGGSTFLGLRAGGDLFLKVGLSFGMGGN